MAEIKSFPNNQSTYVGAEWVMRWLHGRTSGVFAADGNAAVTAASGEMAVEVADGLGWMSNSEGNGVVWWNDKYKTDGSKLKLTIDTADGVLNRIDRIIVEWKTTNYVDLPEIKVLKGTASSTATAPALTNNTTLRQISLAKISVPAGTLAITNTLITDERLDPDVCGLVTESVTADTSMINAQYQAAVEEIETAIAEAWSGVISDGAITTAKIEDGAVTSDKLDTDVSAILADVSEKVDKSGDTMTGDLITSDCAVFIKSTNITDGTVVSALDWGQRFGILDREGNTIGLVHPVFATDGRQGVCLRERRKVSGSTQDAWLTIYLDSSGTETVSVSSANAWLSALGLGSITRTTTISDIATAGSNITITGASYALWGSLAQIQISCKANANISSGATVATIKSGKRPYDTLYLMDSMTGQARMLSNGTVNVQHSISSGDNFSISAVYIVGS